MSNLVRVTIVARDEASKVFQNLGSLIRGNVLSANLMTGAISGGIQLAANAVGQLGSAISGSMQISQENITTAGTMMKMIGMSFAASSTFIDEFSTKMSGVAAALPGATSDYVNLGKGIMDNLVPAFKDANGVFDKEGFKKNLEGITSAGGFLAATAGIDSSFASMGISKFLGGSSESELSRSKFFEANPAVLSFIQAEAKKLGKDMESLTVKERAEVLQRAMKVPDEVIKASTESMAGLTAGFQSALFDPQSGVFGLMKDLSNKTGVQSAFTALQTGVGIVLGSDGIFAQIGTLLASMGLTANAPMESLRSGFLWLNTKLTYINNVLKSMTHGATLDSFANDMGFLFKSLFTIDPGKLGKGMAGAFNSALPVIVALAPILINGIVSGLNWLFNASASFIMAIDWGGVFNGLGAILSALDWGAIGVVALKVLGVAVVMGLTSAAAAAFTASTFAAVIGSLITVVGLVITAPITLIAIAAIGGLALIGKAIYDHWGSISSFFVSSFNSMKSFIAEHWQLIIGALFPPFGALLLGFNLIKGLITTHWETIKAAAMGALSALGNMFTSISGWVTGMIQKIPGMGSFGAVTPTAAPAAPTRSPIQVFPTTTTATPGRVATFADGFIPSGLTDAYRREANRMPSGASVVLANSSEAILNRSQQSAMGGGGDFNGTINIITQATDAKTIAAEVMDEIEIRWRAFKRGKVTPAYS